jgi:hypothetical protein
LAVGRIWSPFLRVKASGLSDRACPFFHRKKCPPKGNHVDKVQSKKCFSLSRSALCRQGHLLVGRQDLAADLIVVRRDGPRLIFHNLPRFYFR